MHKSVSPSSPEQPVGLPQRTQTVIVLVLALLVGAPLIATLLHVRLFGAQRDAGPATEAPAAAVPGSFKASAEQMAGLKLEPVAKIEFRSERVTEGKIAVNTERTTPVFSPYSGRVTRVFANQGDRVEQGTALLAVEAVEFVQAQSDLLGTANTLATARSQLTLAENTEQRKHGLYEAKGGSLQDWQQSQADLVTARNNVHSAESAVALVRSRLRILGKSNAEIRALESAKKINPEAYVRAPIRGTVTDRQIGRGQYIQTGATNPIFSIGDLSTVWLVANVREPDAPLMRRGQPLEVRVLAFPNRVFKARLAYVAPSIDAATRRLMVRAEVENPDGALMPEMFASFSIVTGGGSAAPAVPERAIIYEGDTARVWVAVKNDTVACRAIHTGRTTDGMVEVLDGLEAGEKIVTSGTLFIDRAVKSD